MGFFLQEAPLFRQVRVGDVLRVEDRERLRLNWRRIRGRYVEQPRLNFREWVAVEEEGEGWVQVVTDQWGEGMEDRVREAGLVEIEVETLSLEEIYGYVMGGMNRPVTHGG